MTSKALERDFQPYLVESVDEDDDDEQKQQALAYLLRYETMVRQQEAEDMATLAHIRPCLQRLEEQGTSPQ